MFGIRSKIHNHNLYHLLYTNSVKLCCGSYIPYMAGFFHLAIIFILKLCNENINLQYVSKIKSKGD